MQLPNGKPSQCRSRSSSPDFTLEQRHGSSVQRQPLQESSGNAQQQYGALVRSSPYHGLDYHLSAIPSPPILPTQPLSSSYGPPPTHSRLQQRQQMHLQGRRRRHGINPIWLSPQFQTYRRKQADRHDRPDQIWPDVLEDAFLDGIVYPEPRQDKAQWLTINSPLAHPTHGSQKIHDEERPIRPQYAHRRVSVDRILSKLTAGCQAGPEDDEGAEAGLEPHTSLEEFLPSSPML